MANNICPVCGATFPKMGKRIYCSAQCYKTASAYQKHSYYRAQVEKTNRSWSREQAGRLYNICFDKDSSDVLDRLADYVYNNYKQRKG